jgi:hypothetical protein
VEFEEVPVMGSQWSGRTRQAERVAGQAWDELISAIESGGDAARTFARRTADLADDTGDRIRPALHESKRRAGAAVEAISGRRPPIQWEWILAAAVGGAVLGWVAGALTRRAAEEQFILDETAAANETLAPADHEARLP